MTYLIKKIKQAGFSNTINKLIKALLWEKKNGVSLPIYKKLGLWKKGFKSSSYYIYELDKNSTKNYISDVAITNLSTVNNSEIREFLIDKQKFQDKVHSIVNVPQNIAVIKNGKLIPILKNIVSIQKLISYCLEGRNVVLKPRDGNRGNGIIFLSVTNENIMFNNTTITEVELNNLLSSLDDYLVTEMIEQADYSSNIFPHSTNTIRVLAMRDPQNNFEPFIAIAVHRFGCMETVPADNWSRGGLSSLINLESGKLGYGVRHPQKTNGKIVFYEKHPDTNQQILDISIPFWTDIQKDVIRLTKELDINYVGWDILVTDKTFYFIEGNCNSDLDLLQVHEPLLKNERVKNFLQYYSCI